MRVLIEEYRGWEIMFDTDSEDFYTSSNEYDKEAKKRSYAATKKFIDDFIKDNTEFKPVQVETLDSWLHSARRVMLVGIRKNGTFVSQDKDGKKSQFSKYNEDDFFLSNEANDPIYAQLKTLDEAIDGLRKERKTIENQLIRVSVADYRKKLLGE